MSRLNPAVIVKNSDCSQEGFIPERGDCFPPETSINTAYHIPRSTEEKTTQGILSLHDQNAADEMRFPNHKLGVNRNRIELQDYNKSVFQKPTTNTTLNEEILKVLKAEAI